MPDDVLKEALKQHFGGLKIFNVEESRHLSRLYNVFVFFFHPKAYHNAIKSKYAIISFKQLDKDCVIGIHLMKISFNVFQKYHQFRRFMLMRPKLF